MNRYAAKLLFQFRVTVITANAGPAVQALAQAKRTGRTQQYGYQNSDGNPVDFQFIGVMELKKLELVSEDDEVWYEITERLLPMERKNRFVPPDDMLEAIREERARSSDRGRKKSR